jgi:DNA polymerase III delta prime subunit
MIERELPMEKFKELKHIVYKNIFDNEFNDFEINSIIGAAGFEYYSLAKHLGNVIDKLKGKSQKVIVEAKPLKGDYLLVPKFKKVVKYRYIYKQVKLSKFNKKREVEYLSKIYKLDSDMQFESDEKLNVEKIHPYINDEIEDSVVSFEESINKNARVIKDSNAIFNEKIHAFYVFNNNFNYRELSISLDDISYLCDFLNIILEVRFDGTTYTCDKEVQNEYFSTTSIEKNSLRMEIYGKDREENVFADIDYFFETVEGRRYAIFDDNSDPDLIEVVKSYKDRNEIVIRKSNKEPFDRIPNKLSFEATTINIDRQKKAFINLFNKPSDMNKGLLKLAYGKSVFSNEQRIKVNDSNYRFLTNIKRDGTKEQRLFVEKALATKDFMLLSGPPGTGKTTCILELLYQIFKTEPDARVLLSASTHVAIDNVLERIIEEFEGKLPDNNIYPIRLGNETSIVDNGKVKPFLYEVIKEEDPILAETYLRCSNLVCGTAMGINKYLRIDEEKIVFRREFFDYLIIDEASKTTLQEYIVPAVMCKKHILIGDINQLSPYTDTFLLEVILKSQEQMNQHKEELFYYNFVLNFNDRKDKDILLVVNDKEIIQELSEFDFPNYCFIYEYSQIKLLFMNKNILISKEMYLKYSYFIPMLKKIITLEELPSKDNFKLGNDIESFVKKTEKIRELSDNKIGSNWAKEVAWRYVRFYELKKMDKNYQKQIDWLIIDEKAPGLKSSIEKLGDVSIPSILVKLQEGVKSINGRYPNRLEQGFSKEELDSRFVELIYQHRMHPTISTYAEKSIYPLNKFKSSSSVIERENKLNLFKYNSIFVDVHDNVMKKKDNEKEAMEIVRLIDVIIKKSQAISINFTVAILTFYKSQLKLIKDSLNRYLKEYNTKIFSEVCIDNLKIELYTVDKYQGREADVTLVSLSRNTGLGFMNVPNRINVGLTRAKYYRVVIGDIEHFKNQKYSFLSNIVLESEVYKGGDLL